MKTHSGRAAAILAIAAIGVALTGCAATGPDTGAEGYTIGFISGANNEWGSCLQGGVETEADALGVELLVANSDADAAKEVANLEDMISRGVDAIVLNTVSVDALEGGIQKAKAAGIPLYLVAVVPKSLDDVMGATIVDLGAAGGLAAGWIGEDADGDDVTVAIIAGAPGASSDYVVGGFRGALPANGTVVAEQPGMFNRGKAQEVAENIIQANPGLDYAFVLNEDMAFGARTAFAAAGRPDVKIVTMNGTQPGLQAIEDGGFAATVGDSAHDLGATSLENAVALLDDPAGEKVFAMPIVLITKDNLADARPFCG